MAKAVEQAIVIKARKAIAKEFCSCGGRVEPALIRMSIGDVTFLLEGLRCPQCGEEYVHWDTSARFEKEARKRGLVPPSPLKKM